ncbi:M20 family metallopeptidase [Parasphingopyxis algicola]|uniref:M20/M25/M40 family metallo-hydrolase n=1 Tax=Parasphingopyxis algicola TaxID=2026624 RepID=UPI0015A22297|nr:M20/M25/M40 family metallo-hydrolase [Parasphingopyxis algicola]QLC25130.1 M20 family metallopeptidase [Parasphingopyxis algicola]
MKSFAFSAVTAACLSMVSVPANAQLSPAEQQMTETVDAEYERSISLLERLTNQNSGTRNIAGNRAVMDMLRPEFEALGFAVDYIAQDEVERGGHLLARHQGDPNGTRILLIAHTDTVFEVDSEFQTFVRNGDRATGPGVYDDKGGIIIILAALRAMHAAGTLEDANITVALTGDEEDFGEPVEISRRDLVAAGQWADVALGFESLSIQDGRDMGVIARRSSNAWTVQTSGNEGHSSGIFSEGAGDGAAFELARIIHRFRTELPEPSLTFNVGLMAAGTTASFAEDLLSVEATGKTNIIPPVAMARGDFRTLTQEQTDRVRERMEAIVADHAPGTSASISFDEGYPPMAPTDGNRALLDRLNAVNRDLGLDEQPVLDPLRRGAADISFVAPYADALAGMGPSGERAHAPGETIHLDSIPRQARRAAILISRLAAEPRS